MQRTILVDAMNIRLALVGMLLAAASPTVFAADQTPLFNATLTMGREHRFVLVDTTGKTSSFLALGDSFAGYKLKSYDAKSGVLEVERDGATAKLTLVGDAAIANAPAAPTKATLADAQAVLTAMNFEQMMEKTMAVVRKQQTAMVDQMMGRMVPASGDREAVVELQKRMINEIMSVMNYSEMKDEVAKAYSEVFSKEQLAALGGFFNSPAGQMYTEKQPELAERMNALMAPRMMAAMPKVQQMAKDFAQQMKAKREAAAGGAPATPAPK